MPMYALKRHIIKSAVPASAIPSMNNQKETSREERITLSFKMLRTLRLSEFNPWVKKTRTKKHSKGLRANEITFSF